MLYSERQGSLLGPSIPPIKLPGGIPDDRVLLRYIDFRNEYFVVHEPR